MVHCHPAYYHSTMGFTDVINIQNNIYAVQSRRGVYHTLDTLSVVSASCICCNMHFVMNIILFYRWMS